MIEFDPGPPAAVAEHLSEVPTIAQDQRRLFWYDWGPIFYRGRLDRSARVLCIASDPGPTERVAGRTLVGDAGQRVQGFLTKLGLDRSYVCVNAYPWALRPSMSFSARPVLEAQTVVAERLLPDDRRPVSCKRSSPSGVRPSRPSTSGRTSPMCS